MINSFGQFMINAFMTVIGLVGFILFAPIIFILALPFLLVFGAIIAVAIGIFVAIFIAALKIFAVLLIPLALIWLVAKIFEVI